jgi:hypothetical protein
MKGNATNNVVFLKFIIFCGVPTVITHTGRQENLATTVGWLMLISLELAGNLCLKLRTYCDKLSYVEAVVTSSGTYSSIDTLVPQVVLSLIYPTGMLH